VHREVFDTVLRAIELMSEVTIEMRDTLQTLEVKMVAVLSDFQTTIQCAAHLVPGPWQCFTRRINVPAKALLTLSIATEIYWVPAHIDIPGQTDADCQVNLAQDPTGVMVIERPYTTA